MEKDTSSSFSFESVDFVFRHPWVILFTFLIIANIFHAYAKAIRPEYRVNAILSFETAPGVIAGRDVINEKKDAAEKILFVSNIEPILEQALKGEAAEESSKQYRELASKLRNPKTGMSLIWETKETRYLLKIGFSYNNPKICYNTVRAIMDMIVKESEQKVEREMEENLSFLNNQLKFYKDKLDTINKEAETIRDDLINKFPELSDEEKELVAKYSKNVDITKTEAVLKYKDREETVSKLRANLAELQKKRDKLNRMVDSGTFTTQYNIDELGNEDVYLSEHAKAISAKELEIASLVARGYKDDHPQVIQLQQEVDHIKKLRWKRIGRQEVIEPGTKEYEDTKEKTLFEIKELDLRIAYAKESLEAADESKKIATTQLKSGMVKNSDVKKKVAMLASLDSEKSINETYYMEMKKKMADAELKYRTDKENFGFKIITVKEPEIPNRPDPARAQAIILRGFIIALLFSIGIAYFMEKLQDPIRSDGELAELLGLPVLALIDRIATAQEIASKDRQLKYAALGTAAIIIFSRILVAMIFSAKG